MVFLVLNKTAETAGDVLGLFTRFMESIGAVAASGIGGFVLALLILSLVLFCVWKFLFSSAKIIIILLLAGAAILAVFFLT
jgi:hypothetical protein